MNIFQKIKVKVEKRNTFDLSHDHKLSMNMGKLIPFYVQECLPGDIHKLSTEALIRMQPMLSPVMHKVDVFIHYFFVPNRIIWKDWELFITNDPNVAHPYFQGTDEEPIPIQKGSIFDYMGLPITTNMKDKINALPWFAYQKIWLDYYIDQNLDPAFAAANDWNAPSGDASIYLTANITDSTMPRTRAWMHDYFTSALPWAQKGQAVNIPLSLSGQADLTRVLPSLPDTIVEPGTDTVVPSANLETDINGFLTGDGTQGAQIDLQNIKADLEGQGQLSGTINDLRRAYAIQRWLEMAARAGSRYYEQLMVHWGVKSQDARLQRAEYIGGSKQPVIISEVLQTSQTDETVTPQGNMAGHGVSAGSGNRFKFYCPEHGWIIGIVSILPVTAYQQGIPRAFSKLSVFDYAFPVFAHLGEQEVLNKEIYYDKDDPDTVNNATFGYMPRYAEYKFNPSRVSGEFRDTLSFWHMGRIFQNRPQLNTDFVYADPTKRIFAVTDADEDSLLCHLFIRNFCSRKLPYFGTPI